MGKLLKQSIPMFDTTDAKCTSEDPDMFMPEGSNHIQVTRQAKAVCASCPLAKTCLEYAIASKEWGIWGGTTMKERDYLRRYPSRKAEYLQILVRSNGTRDLVTLKDENNLI